MRKPRASLERTGRRKIEPRLRGFGDHNCAGIIEPTGAKAFNVSDATTLRGGGSTHGSFTNSASSILRLAEVIEHRPLPGNRSKTRGGPHLVMAGLVRGHPDNRPHAIDRDRQDRPAMRPRVLLRFCALVPVAGRDPATAASAWPPHCRRACFCTPPLQLSRNAKRNVAIRRG